MREDSSGTASKQKKLEELLMELGSSVEHREAEPTIYHAESPIMEHPAPAPADNTPSQFDLSSDGTRLSRKRAQIRDRIESTLFSPLPIDEPLSLPTMLNDLEEIEQDHQQIGTISDVTSLASPVPVQETPRLSVPPQSDGHHSFWSSGKGRYLIGLLVCLISLGGAELFWVFQQTHTPPSAPTWQVTVTPFSTSTVQPTPTATLQTITPTPTPTQQVVATAQPAKEQPKEAVPVVSSSSPPISFESGKEDGWKIVEGDDAVNTVKNVKTKESKDGNYALMVSFDSESDDDNTPDSYPCVATSNFPVPLTARQTITAYVMKHKGSKVQASLYAIDSTGKWYKANDTKGGTTLVQNDDTWYSITFTLPADFKGSASQVGLILFGYNAVVYIDDVSWHS
ncbi:hypothetical protein KSF_035900 [Reticulibacter mediterranei]|uniref:Uncharacterized protein n=1 Tax=Reticulibacter mediterranei TaxID=2778369 RepID=A0A8J3N3V8_9CHLR|nr:hypothetical protein [Reticulibacter mediterranei]GHO93542.1 hypothetical protein KSF_035900 [Reticulibacter mediterranei]